MGSVKGSEKQITWAEGIKRRTAPLFDDVRGRAESLAASMPSASLRKAIYSQLAEETVKKARSVPHAWWWIDIRDFDSSRLFDLLLWMRTNPTAEGYSRVKFWRAYENQYRSPGYASQEERKETRMRMQSRRRSLRRW